jgi:hypothetical protein
MLDVASFSLRFSITARLMSKAISTIYLCSYVELRLKKAAIVRANILKILLYSFVFIENFLTPGTAGVTGSF